MRKKLLPFILLPFIALAACEKKLEVIHQAEPRKSLGLELPLQEDVSLDNTTWYVIIDEQGLENTFVNMQQSGDDTLVLYAMSNEDFEARQRNEDRLMAYIQKLIQRFNLMKEYYEGDAIKEPNGNRDGRGPTN